MNWSRAGPLPKENEGADDLCDSTIEEHWDLVALVELRLPREDMAPREPTEPLERKWRSGGEAIVATCARSARVKPRGTAPP